MVASRGNDTNPTRIPALGARFFVLVVISILLIVIALSVSIVIRNNICISSMMMIKLSHNCFFFILSPHFKANRLFTSLGMLDDGEGDRGAIFAIGPDFALRSAGGRWVFALGGGIALLSDSRFGDHDFGGTNQFFASLGLGFLVHRHIRMGYRLHHMSDAGIHDGKDLNTHMLELGYVF